MDEAEKPQEGTPPQAQASGSVGPMGAMGEFSEPGAAPVARSAPVAPVGPMGEIRLDVSESAEPMMKLAVESAPEVASPEVIESETFARVEPEAPSHAEPSETTAEIPIAPARVETSYAVEAPSVPLEYITPQPVHRKPLPAWVRWPVIAAVIAFAFVAARYQGWELRKYAYMWGDGMHWGDAANAYTLYGRVPQEKGLFATYEKIKSGDASVDQAKLDYPPLRLAIISQWVKWGADPKRNVVWGSNPSTPGLNLYHSRFIPMEPMLQLNMACEGISAILIFALIWIWTRRMRDPNDPGAAWLWPVVGFVVFESIAAYLFVKDGNVADMTTLFLFYFGGILLARMVPGLAPAFAGALLFWFNPAVIWNAYVWPQWDVWIFPFILGALLLASTEWWFSAGVLIAIGALIKGQLLLAAPVFLLWPLFRLQWMQLVRFTGGFVLAFAAIVFPWLLPSMPAKIWLGLVAVSLGLLTPIVLGMKLNKPLMIGLPVVALLLTWPWASGTDWEVRICALSVVALAALSTLAPRRLIPSIYAIALGVAVFLLIPLFGASNAWYTQGYKYGTEKFMEMGTTVSGNGGSVSTNNLPMLFQRLYPTWGNDPSKSELDITWLKWVGLGFLGPTATVRNVMFSIYAVCLLLCGIGAAIHSKRGDSRLLLCIITPWICSFVILTQLNNRYLIWAAGLSALLPAVGVGMTLLGIIVSIACWIGMAQLQYAKFPVDPGMSQYLAPLSPHIGWAIALAAAVYLYVAVMPRRREMLPIAAEEPST